MSVYNLDLDSLVDIDFVCSIWKMILNLQKLIVFVVMNAKDSFYEPVKPSISEINNGSYLDFYSIKFNKK